MIIYKSKKNELIKELNIRYSILLHELEGRQARPEDSARITNEILSNCVLIREDKLRLSLLDFNTILSEIKRLK